VLLAKPIVKKGIAVYILIPGQSAKWYRIVPKSKQNGIKSLGGRLTYMADMIVDLESGQVLKTVITKIHIFLIAYIIICVSYLQFPKNKQAKSFVTS